jgi:hypothetical protein
MKSSLLNLAKSFICSSFFFRISEIEPKYYADGEDAYAMKRNLVMWAQLMDISPADAESFFRPAKNSDDKKKS